MVSSFDIPRAYGSYEALLADDDLDAVYNPLPNNLHAEWTRRAADAGLDVLCEKPLAVDADEARSMATHCDEHDVTMMETFMYRYHPCTEHAHEIATEVFGEIRLIEATFQFPVDDSDSIRLNSELDGGSRMDVSCYAINAARLFLGDPDQVYATTDDPRRCGVETHHSGILEYENGVIAQVSSSLDTPDGREAVKSFDPTDQYRLEVEHFAECVEQNWTPRTDASEAIRTLTVIDALKASAERGSPVAID